MSLNLTPGPTEYLPMAMAMMSSRSAASVDIDHSSD
jgi:hypothetical protein